MTKLCTMASHVHPHGLGVIFVPEKVYNRVAKDIHHLVPNHGPNQDLVSSQSLNFNSLQKEDCKSAGGFVEYDQFVNIDSTSRRPSFIDAQDTNPERLSFGIMERCTKQEKILKLLASESIEDESGLLDSSLLYDIMGPQSLISDLSQQRPFSSCSRWYSNDPQPLIFPTREFYFNEPLLDLDGNMSDFSENPYHTYGQLQINWTGTDMHDILSVISHLHLSKSSTKSVKQTMLVPYFERRKRARSNINALKLATEKAESLKSQEKAKKASQKKKTSTTRGRGEIYFNSYLHACESLLSIIVDRNRQNHQAVLSLKKSGSQLPQLLVQFSASIAGTGIALVLSVLCRVACSRVPFCASKLWGTGLGLGLVWLSWAVNKLRDTVISISKTSGNEKEDEMMDNLDRDLKEIYFRVAALMAVAVLRLA